jgi:exosortase family protein XrtM
VKNNFQLNPNASPNILLVISFICLLIILQFLWSNAHDSVLERLIVDEITVKPSAWLIMHITPEISVTASGSHLSAIGGGLNILRGCDGVDVILLLAAAMLVAPIKVLHRLIGILTGIGLIYISNQIRILALFYSYRTDRPLFNLLHGTIAPFLLILIAASFYIIWVGMHDRLQKRKLLTT